jgi:hypothetical protein
MNRSATIQAYLGALGAIAAAMTPAQSSATEALSCRRVEILVPYEAGGGTDLYARYLAPMLSSKLPGKPEVVVKNVEGAGAIAGSNQFEERAKPDGCSLIAIAASVTSNYVFRDRRVRYKLDEWIPIISSPAGTVVYTSSKLGLKDASELAKLKGQQLVMGANNPTGGDMRVLLSLDLLGLGVKPIYGINRGDARPGFERGEFNINFDSSQAYPIQVQPLVDSKVAVPIFSLGIAGPDGKIVRDPIVPNLPTFNEAYKAVHGKDPSGPAYDAWLAVFNLNVMASKALALPAGTPKDIANVYHNVMAEVVKDLQRPEIKEKADDVVGPYPQALGEAAANALRGAIKFDPEAESFLRDWVKKQQPAKN